MEEVGKCVLTQTQNDLSERLKAVYLQGLHGQVRGVVVMDFAGIPGSFFVEVVRRL